MRNIALIALLFVPVLALGFFTHLSAPGDEDILLDQPAVSPLCSGSRTTPSDTIGQCSGLGGPCGRNIAVCGDSIAVVWGSPSLDPLNYFYVSYSYSTDRGATWPNTGQVMYDASRRVYPGVDWDPNATVSKPYFAWQVVDGNPPYPDVPSTIYITWDADFPNGFMPPPITLPNSADWHSWLPCVAVKDSMVIVTAYGYQSQNGYIWRSTDYGLTWNDGDTLINTQASSYESMNPPIVRFGENGHVFAVFDWAGPDDIYIPHYTESTDWGVNWNGQYNLWDLTGGSPYTGCTGSHWDAYDCVVDTNSIPQCVWKFQKGTYEFGDIWIFRPTAGSPGDWTSWERTCIVGDGDGGRVATQPTISIDPATNHFHVIYRSIWRTPLGETPDIGHIFSTDGGNTWIDRGCGDWYDLSSEMAAEVARLWRSENEWSWGHVAYVAEGDWLCEWVDSLNLLAVDEISISGKLGVDLELTNFPNPSRHTTQIFYSLPAAGVVRLRIYNISGQLVNTLISEKQTAGSHRVEWDGRTDSGDQVMSGVYFYRIDLQPLGESTTHQATGKMLILR